MDHKPSKEFLLYFEIGTVNNLLDNFRAFVEEEIEVLSDIEKAARNRVIITDVSHSKAKELIDAWNSDGGSIELRAFRVEKAQLNAMARRRGLSQEQVRSLNEQREDLDRNIAALDAQQKLLEKDASTKRSALSEAKKALKKSNQKRRKWIFLLL